MNALHPSDYSNLMAEAATRLLRGEVVAYPTETCYGLAVVAKDATAFRRLTALKGRREDHPVSLLVTGSVETKRLAFVPPVAQGLMERFWPGPLTLVLPAFPGRLAHMQSREGTLGFRCSSHPLALALLRRVATPLTSTSANHSGEAPATTEAEVRRAFPDLFVLPDPNPSDEAMPSTVLRIYSGGQTRLLRAGSLDEATLFGP